MDPHSFSKLDPDRHSLRSWIQIRIKSMRNRNTGFSFLRNTKMEDRFKLFFRCFVLDESPIVSCMVSCIVSISIGSNGIRF
jgi:hypothetical protein